MRTSSNPEHRGTVIGTRCLLFRLLLIVSFAHLCLSATAAPYCQARTLGQVLVSSSGQQVFVAVEDGDCSELVAFDFVSGKVQWRDRGVRSVAAMALSSSGSRLAVSYAGEGSQQTRPLIVIDTATGKVIAAAVDHRPAGVVLTGRDASALALSPDGRTLFAVLHGQLAAWNAVSGNFLFSQDDPAGSERFATSSLQVSADGKHLLGAGANRTYLLKLTASPSSRAALAAVTAQLATHDSKGALLSPNGLLAAVLIGDNTLIWQPGANRKPLEIAGCGKQIAWAPDGHSIACVTSDELALIKVDTQTGKTSIQARLSGLPVPTPFTTDAGLFGYLISHPVAGAGEPAVTIMPVRGGASHTIVLPARQ